MKVDADAYYSPRQLEDAGFASASTLARWRCTGSGPVYTKLGGRIAYRGSRLLEWLSSRERRSTLDDLGED